MKAGLGLRYTLGGALLLVIPPVFVHLLWYTNAHLNGSLLALVNAVQRYGLASVLKRAIPTPFDPAAWRIISTYAIVQMTLMTLVPGRVFKGPVTPMGNVPVYKANGVQCFFASVALFIAGAAYGLYPGSIVYDHAGHLLSSMNVLALAFCLVLYLKGIVAPSSTDSGMSGNVIFDYFWGTELYPRIASVDVKMFTNCRFGMVFWAIGPISYMFWQHARFGYVANSLAISVALQLIYVTKFFVWETGYLASMDIMHDRAGYYICWGCLVFLPVVYTSQAYYLASHPIQLSTPLATAIFVAGLACIWLNYDCDRQRKRFRESRGNSLVWGRPAEYITARYTAGDGTAHESLLLCSGWWGVSRHFHYIPEVLASFFWSLPALFNHFMPYLYTVYLAILLADRAIRDEKRCRDKYGKDWDKYCARIPYYVIPYVF